MNSDTNCRGTGFNRSFQVLVPLAVFEVYILALDWTRTRDMFTASKSSRYVEVEVLILGKSSSGDKCACVCCVTVRLLRVADDFRIAAQIDDLLWFPWCWRLEFRPIPCLIRAHGGSNSPRAHAARSGSYPLIRLLKHLEKQKNGHA